MSLALFDLDHTLLDGDTNSLWLDFLVENGHLPRKMLDLQSDFMQRYAAEALDIVDYLAFHLRLLAERPLNDWQPVRDEFIAVQIVPRLSAQAFEVIAAHRTRGDRMAIITATHSFLSTPIGQAFGIPVIAPRPEIRAGHVTGRIDGSISFREEKLVCLAQWMADEGLVSVGNHYFYSDSINDLPLLEAVSHPQAVNPDARLQALAQVRGWPIHSWRKT